MNERLELVPLGYKRRVEISHRLFSTILQPYIISSIRAPIAYIDINTNANKLINQQSLFAFHNSNNGISSHTPQKTRSLVPVGVPHATPAGFRISCLAPNQTSRCHTHEHTTTRALSPALKSSESRPLKKNNAKRQISPVRLKPSPIPNTPSKARNDWHHRDRMKLTKLPKKGRIKTTQVKIKNS